MSAERLSWQAVREAIRRRILDGSYGPGERLPRDSDLAGELGCSRATVQRAMRELSDAGLVDRRRKGGTRVDPAPVTRATLEIPLVRAEIEARGAAYGYQLLGRETVETPPAIAAAFELPAPEPMLHLTALHLADRRPWLWEDRWVSLLTVPEIETVDLGRESANEWLLRNRPYSRCDVVLHAEAAAPDLARVMDCAPGAALFVIDRTTWIGSRPITTVKAVAAPGYRLRTRA